MYKFLNYLRIALVSLFAVLVFNACSKDDSTVDDDRNDNPPSVTPTDSVPQDNNDEDVKYQPSVSGNIGGYDYVDLGLKSGTKWATCNIGATNPEEYGDYYAWGETKTSESYEKENCKLYGISYSDLMSNGVLDKKGNLVAKYDAVTANLGTNWRMPTSTEIEELLTLKSEFIVLNGIKGTKFIGKNGNTIFLPYAGFRVSGRFGNAGDMGYYWTATAVSEISANKLYLYRSDCGLADTYHLEEGYSIRPVLR